MPDDAAGTVAVIMKQAWGLSSPPLPTTGVRLWTRNGLVKMVVGMDVRTWQNFYAMASADDPISTIANGTGPFKLDKFVNQDEIVLVRNDEYWEPAKLAKVVFKQVPEWGTRFAMMQTGDLTL